MTTGTLLGLDIGSSSVKGVLLDLESGLPIAQATSPSQEMAIEAAKSGWAEQHPDLWWEHVCRVIGQIRERHPQRLLELKGIGIAYQMHGLVLVDRSAKALRPSIIWCDSRAVELGAEAFKALGEQRCLTDFGNSPGNFTAAKLAWVKRNEPQIIEQAAHCMLPGDYIALKLTGEFGTTQSGLSEGVMWDFSANDIAKDVLNYFQIPLNLVPKVGANVGAFAGVRGDVAKELGLPPGVPVTYRAGDQPNNALALNVLRPGEVAANAGTSGVVYGVTAKLGVDPLSRVNHFLHVNSSAAERSIGVLMCVNGTGSFYRWARATFCPTVSYPELNTFAAQSPIGSNGLVGLPYGNGAERTLGNRVVGAGFHNIDLNRHSLNDVLRATQEGIVFALCHGIEIMREMGLSPSTIRAGNANMFQSPIFRDTLATTVEAPIELYTTDGAIGAARGAGIGAGAYTYQTAFKGLRAELTIEPQRQNASATKDAYNRWREALAQQLGQSASY